MIETDKEDWESRDYSAFNVGVEDSGANVTAPTGATEDWESRDYSAFNVGEEPEPVTPVGETDTPEPPDEYTIGERASDVGAAFGRGAGSLVGGFGWLADIAGMDDAAQAMYEFSDRTVKYYNDKMSPEAKAELSKEFVTTKAGGKWYNPLDWERPEDAAGVWAAVLMGAESIPATTLGMAGGGALGATLYKVGLKTSTLGGLAKVAEVGQKRAAMGLGASDDLVAAGVRAEKVLNRFGQATGAVGYGLGEAVPSAGMAGREVQNTVLGMTHEELWDKSAHYREIFAASEGLDMSFEERYREAKESLAELASSAAGMQSGIATFALGAPAGAFSAPLFNKMMPKNFATGRLAGAGKEGAGEAVQEFFQSGAEAYISNLAIREYADETMDVSKDVINQAVGGAVSGFGMGATFGLAGTPEAAQDGSGSDIDPKQSDDVAKIKAFATNAHAALTEHWGMTTEQAMEYINPLLEDFAQNKNLVGTVTDLRHLEQYGVQREKGKDDLSEIPIEELGQLVQETDRNGIDYGFFEGTVDNDKGRLDWLREKDATGTGIFVIAQAKADGTFDEHKIVLGANTEEEARATYSRYYRGFDDEQDRNIGSITQMNEKEFSDWRAASTAENAANHPIQEVLDEQEKERNEATASMEENAKTEAANKLAKPEEVVSRETSPIVTDTNLKRAKDESKPTPDEMAEKFVGTETEVVTDSNVAKAKNRAIDIRYSLSPTGRKATGKGAFVYSEQAGGYVQNKKYRKPGTLAWADAYIRETSRDKYDPRSEYNEDYTEKTTIGAFPSKAKYKVAQFTQDSGERLARSILFELKDGNVDSAKSAYKKLRRYEGLNGVVSDALYAMATKAGIKTEGTKKHGGTPTKEALIEALDKWVAEPPKDQLPLFSLAESKAVYGEGVADVFVKTTGIINAQRTPSIKLAVKEEWPTGITTAETPEDVAHVAAPLRKEAQESLLGVITDKDNNVLGIIRHSMGDQQGSGGYPTLLVGGALQMDGAANFWMVHNHPSGMSEQSGTDAGFSTKLAALMQGTGIEFKGSVVVTMGGEASFYHPAISGTGGSPIGITKAARKKKTPVVQRTFKTSKPSGDTPIESPDAAKQHLSGKGNGVLLLNTRHVPIRFIPMTLEEMKKLRTGDATTGAGKLLKAVSETNASAMMIQADGENDPQRAASNMKGFAQASAIRFLDAIVNGESTEQSATPLLATGGVFYSLADKTTPWTISRTKGEGDLYIARHGTKAGTPSKTRQGPNDLVMTLDKEVLLPDYVYYLLQYLQPQIAQRARGAAQQAITAADVSEVLTDHFKQAQKPTSYSLYSLSGKEQSRRKQASERMTAYNREKADGRAHLVKTIMRMDWAAVNAQVDADTAGAVTPDEIQDAIVEFMMKGVSSKYFKRWFGKSQTVDKWGTPIRFFHGTGATNITAFHKSKGFVSLTTDPAFASEYATYNQMSATLPTVYPVYVKAEKIFDYRNKKMRRSLMRHMKSSEEGKQKLRDTPTFQQDLEEGHWGALESNVVKKFMAQRGYDAFWMREYESLNLGVFDPQNIKSAVGNIGTFRQDINHLRYSLIAPGTDEVFYSALESWVDKAMNKIMPKKDFVNGFEQPNSLANKGVKKEEVEDIGLLEWAASLPDNTVTKEQVLDFVRSNKTTLIEVERRSRKLANERGLALKTWSDSADYQLNILREEVREALVATLGAEEGVDSIMQDYEDIGVSALDDHLPATMVTKFDSKLNLAMLDKWQQELAKNQSEDEIATNDSGDTLNWTQESLGWEHNFLTMTGGPTQSYREILLRIPDNPDNYRFVGQHWNESNVLMHMRLHGQFDSSTGKNTMVVEEIQSDWHQSGYRYGYSSSSDDRLHQAAAFDEEGKVPPAPMKQSWRMVAMKRLIRYAAENGYDSLSWSTGNLQHQRYLVGDQLHSVQIEERPRGQGTNPDQFTNPVTGSVYRLLMKRSANAAASQTPWVLRHQLGKYITEELVDRMFAKADRTISGDELQWDANAIKAFYDNHIKKLTAKYIKKWGSAVELRPTTITGPDGSTKTIDLWSFDITPQMRESIMKGQPLYSLADSAGAEIGRRLELYQLQAYIQSNTASTTKPKAMKARLIKGVEKGLYSAEILRHSGVMESINDRSKMLFQVASRIRGKEVKARTALPSEVVRQELRRVTMDWKNAPRFHVHDSWHGLPSHIKNDVLAHGYQSRVEGVVDPMDGSIHIVASNIHTMERLHRVYTEESLGHAGLRAFFGEEALTPFLKDVMKDVQGSPAWNELQAQYEHLQPSPMADRVATLMKYHGLNQQEAKQRWAQEELNKKLVTTEELIAKLDVSQNVWDKFVSWVREWLRKAGLITNYTDNDLRRVMSVVHGYIISGRTPHAWGRRNITPAYHDGALSYSLYGGPDAVLISKLEKALGNKKMMISNKDSAKPKEWLTSLKGTDNPQLWREYTAESKARAGKLQFSENELKLTGVVDFLMDRHASAPEQAVSIEEVLDVFNKTKPKIMAVSRAGHYRLPSLPLADLIYFEDEEAYTKTQYNETRAREEMGYFSDNLRAIMDEPDHKTLRSMFVILSSEHESTPVSPQEFLTNTGFLPFGKGGVPTMAEFKAKGTSDEELSRLMSVPDAKAPMTYENSSALIRGVIAELFVTQLQYSDNTAYRETELLMTPSLYGYRVNTNEYINIKYTTNRFGEVDMVYSPNGGELVDKLNRALDKHMAGWKADRGYREELEKSEVRASNTFDWQLGTPAGETFVYGPMMQNPRVLIKKEFERLVKQKIADLPSVPPTELTPSDLFPEYPFLSSALLGYLTRGSVSTTNQAEHVAGGTTSDRDGGSSTYESYTIGGGEDIDVLSIQLYDSTKNQSVSGNAYGNLHYDERMKQDVVHLRLKTRMGEGGERYLSIEEVQSDWASNYRKTNPAGEAATSWAEKHGIDIVKTFRVLRDAFGYKTVFDSINSIATDASRFGTESQIKDWLDGIKSSLAFKLTGTPYLSRNTAASPNVISTLLRALPGTYQEKDELIAAHDKALQEWHALDPDWEAMPWINTYADLAMNTAIAYARDTGFDGVIWYNTGDTAASLYGAPIYQPVNSFNISLDNFLMRGSNHPRAEDTDPMVPSIIEASKISNDVWTDTFNANIKGNHGEYYVDYLNEIIRDGGPNAEVAQKAKELVERYIEEGGANATQPLDGATIDTPFIRLEQNKLLVVLPQTRQWNARIHKLLYEHMMVQAAKKVSKKSYSKVFIKEAYNRAVRVRQQRSPANFLQFDRQSDRINGRMNSDDTHLKRSAQLFGRNGQAIRELLKSFWLNDYEASSFDARAVDEIVNVGDLVPLTKIKMRAERLTATGSLDYDNQNPWGTLLEFSYDMGGVKKRLQVPYMDFADSFLGEASGEDYRGWVSPDSVSMLYRTAYYVMRDIWGIENPNPFRLSRDAIRQYIWKPLFVAQRDYINHDPTVDSRYLLLWEALKKTAKSWKDDTSSSAEEATTFYLPWEPIDGGTEGVPEHDVAILPDPNDPQIKQLVGGYAVPDKYELVALRAIMMPLYDADTIDTLTEQFNAMGVHPLGASWPIPSAYLENIPETGATPSGVGSEPEPKTYDVNNPERGEQVFNLLKIDDAVKAKEIPLPFSLKSKSDPVERKIVNEKIARSHSQMTVLDRVTHWVNSMRQGIATGDVLWGIKQGVLDSTASVERIEREVFGEVLDASLSPHKMMHMTKNLPSVMAAISKVGIPEMVNGVFQPKAGRKGFVEIMRPLYEHPEGDLLELWEGYAAARRSDELLTQQNQDGTSREKLFTREQVDKLLALGDKYPVFKTVFDEWTSFNNDLLNLAVKHGVLSARERDAWADNAYVPFYRAMEEIEGIDQRTGFGRIKAGVEGQRSGIRRLYGGTQMLGSVVENMWFNTASLIDKIYKNEAMGRVVAMAEGVAMNRIEMPWEAVKVTNQQLASALHKAGLLSDTKLTPLQQVNKMTTEQRLRWSTIFRRVKPTGDNVVSWMNNGKPVYFEVTDELLLRTLTGMGAEGMAHMMKVMSMSKGLLTRMVTIDPGFMLANWLRDTLSAWVTSDANFIPVVDSIKAMGDVWKEDGSFVKMMMSGAGGGGFYDLTGGDVTRALDEELNRSTSRWLSKAWRGYMKLGAMSENSNRLAIANKTIKSGGTVAEGMHAAQDVMNFTMSGDYEAVRFLIRTVPFLNARMQGLYRLYRGARDDKLGFALKGSAIMFATMALLAKNWDDPDYDDTEDWMKDLNWNFFVDGVQYTIPKPFEVGLLFATIPERVLSLLLGRDDLEVSKEALLRGLGETLAFNPTPQLFKPMVELYANWNMFSQSPIENQSISRFEPEYRAYPWTSPVAQKIGDAIPEWMGAAQSPARIEHTIRAYTGTVGLYTLGALDWLVRQADPDLPEMPAKKWYERPVISRIVKGDTDTTRYNKYEQKVYDALDKSYQAQNTFNMLAKTQRLEEAKEIATKRKHLINPNMKTAVDKHGIPVVKPVNEDAVTPRSQLLEVQAVLREISAQQRAIMAGGLDAKTKRERLDQLTIRKNQVLKNAATLLKKLKDIKDQ